MPQPDPLLALVAAYNPAIRPTQLIAYAGAAVVLALVAWRPSRRTDRLASAFLAATWLFVGIAFHAAGVAS
jgi:hypothetical protein